MGKQKIWCKSKNFTYFGVSYITNDICESDPSASNVGVSTIVVDCSLLFFQ
jgi:hypothetical protein